MQNSNLDGVLSNVNSFDFDAEHNGVQCVASLNPEDVGTNNQFWFTAKMLCEIFKVANQTLRDNINNLKEDGEICYAETSERRAMRRDSGGVPHPVVLYNLEVLNKLGMCCFRGNKKAKEIRNAFNDVLVKHETSTQQSMLPSDYISALEALLASEKEKLAVQKALDAEKEQHKKDNEDFCEYVDILNQKKAEISTRREATAMNTASQKSKECKRLTVENTKLTTENEELKDEVGRGTNWKQVTAIEWYDEFFIKSRDANFYSQCGRILTQISKEMGIEVGKVQDTKYTKNSYYISVVDEFRNRLENGVTFSRIKQYYRHNYNLTLF